MKCKHHECGCTWIGDRADWQFHSNNCAHRNSPCCYKEYGCEWQGTKVEMDEKHSGDCPYKVVEHTNNLLKDIEHKMNSKADKSQVVELQLSISKLKTKYKNLKTQIKKK